MTPSVDPVASLAEKHAATVAHLKDRIPAALLPLQVGIICGSGLGGLVDNLTETTAFRYEAIPHFPHSTVAGHEGKLVVGKLAGKNTICMVGRFHFYEGHAMSAVTYPIRVMRLLGIQVLIVTNAAGGLNPDFSVGDVMLIDDHINFPGLAGNNPLIGPNDATFGPRFPPMSNAYNADLRSIAKVAATRVPGFRLASDNPSNASDASATTTTTTTTETATPAATAEKRVATIREGTYCFVSGPGYESISEANFLRTIGGDAVGMSTVPEVMVAHHAGIKVLGISLITNKVVMRKNCAQLANHEEVMAAGRESAKSLQALVETIVGLISI